MGKVLLEASGISKAFPGVKALDDVSLQVEAGQIVALVGHNGSGKSTLVKILAGVYQADDGVITTPGGRAPGAGKDDGLHFIHQDLGLIPMLTAVENIDLSRQHGRRSLLPFKSRKEQARARELVAQFGAHFNVNIPVVALSPAERTIVAIARALDGWTSNDNVLVLDEPTAALQEEEVRKLFAAVRRVVAAGAGVIIISHRLDEVVELADRVVVLRDGTLVADQTRGNFDKKTLVQLIAGVEESPEVELAAHNSGGDVMLSLRGLSCAEIKGLDLEVRAGEIVGVTGLLGSGMEQIGGAVFGSIPSTGEVVVGGKSVKRGAPKAAVAAGVGFVPSDRRSLGSVITMNARENLTLPLLRPLRNAFGSISISRERADATEWMNRVDVKPRGSSERTFSLFSGGNQQKVIIAKWMRNLPRVLVLEEPTQGVDVGAQSSIHALIARVASEGAAVLISSSDTKELVSLCHRVVVLHEGVIAGTFEGVDLTESNVLKTTLDPMALADNSMNGGPSNG